MANYLTTTNDHVPLMKLTFSILYNVHQHVITYYSAVRDTVECLGCIVVIELFTMVHGQRSGQFTVIQERALQINWHPVCQKSGHPSWEEIIDIQRYTVIADLQRCFPNHGLQLHPSCTQFQLHTEHQVYSHRPRGTKLHPTLLSQHGTHVGPGH